MKGEKVYLEKIEKIYFLKLYRLTWNLIRRVGEKQSCLWQAFY